MPNMQHKHIHLKDFKPKDRALFVTITGLFATLVFVVIEFVYFPVAGGTVHLGDAIIFMSSYFLGPYAAICGAVGGAFADLVGGHPQYMFATIIIKGLIGLVSGFVLVKLKGKAKNFSHYYFPCAITFVLCEIFMVMGYFVYKLILYGFSEALVAMFSNILQGICGVIFALVFLPVLHRVKAKDLLE